MNTASVRAVKAALIRAIYHLSEVERLRKVIRGNTDGYHTKEAVDRFRAGLDEHIRSAKAAIRQAETTVAGISAGVKP